MSALCGLMQKRSPHSKKAGERRPFRHSPYRRRLERVRDEADAGERKRGKQQGHHGEADTVGDVHEFGHGQSPLKTQRLKLSQFVNFAICLCPV